MVDKNDIICPDKFLNLNDENIAYVKTDVLEKNRKIKWRGKEHTYRKARIWITGHATYPITQKIFGRYKENCDVWYTVNKEVNDPNLRTIPLGITNDCDDSPTHKIFGNTDIMIEVMNMPRNIKNLVFMNFSLRNCKEERQQLYNLLKNQSWVTNAKADFTLEGRKYFLEELRNHKFVLSPRGVGIDTHRMWETLYMGSIPIVKRHLALDEFLDLPICWVNDWNEVTEEFLNSEYKRITESSWNMEKLKMSYWVSIIQNEKERLRGDKSPLTS
jgi:hypothetical protein